MTGEAYEFWRWGYWHGEDYAGDQSIKEETVISKAITIKEAIEIAIDDRECDYDQVGVDHDKRSRSKECVQHHVTRDQHGDRDQEVIVIGDQVCDRDQASVGYATRSVTRRRLRSDMYIW